MSGFGRALAGLGAGAAALSGKYIDEELAQQRAQALSDIQFANAKRTEEFEQSETVQGRRMVNQRKALEMQGEVQLEAKTREASSQPLQEALRNNKKSEAAIAGQVEREEVVARGSDASYLRASRALASATRFVGPGEELARFQLQQAQQIAGLRQRIANEKDPTKREELQQQEAALTGTAKNSKDLSVALAQTVQAASRARGVLSDPMADQEAKDSAREALATLDWSAKNLQRLLGGAPSKTDGQDDPLMQALIANREAGKGKQAGKSAPAGSPPAPSRPAGDTSQFDRMTDQELDRYVKAGNTVAKEVKLQRMREAAKPVNAGGLDQGY